MTKLGLNFQPIPWWEIPFDDTQFQTDECIHNGNGVVLIYKKKDRLYQMVTNDPSIFLDDLNRYTVWELF